MPCSGQRMLQVWRKRPLRECTGKRTPKLKKSTKTGDDNKKTSKKDSSKKAGVRFSYISPIILYSLNTVFTDLSYTEL